jgi:NADH:ubiquinone oxidoreductase subunit 4 (subunit M)
VNFQWTVFAAIGVILSACYMLWLYQRIFFGRMPGQTAEADHGHGGHGNPPSHSHDHGHDHPHDHTHDHEHSHEHSHDHWHMPDLSVREWAAILPLVVLMVWMGMGPQTFLPSIGTATAKTLEQSKANVEYKVKSPPIKIQPVQEASNAR